MVFMTQPPYHAASGPGEPARKAAFADGLPVLPFFYHYSIAKRGESQRNILKYFQTNTVWF
jgi:hypothetical protein